MAKIFEQAYTATWIYQVNQDKVYRIVNWDNEYLVFLNLDFIAKTSIFTESLDKVVEMEGLSVTSVYTSPKKKEDDYS